MVRLLSLSLLGEVTIGLQGRASQYFEVGSGGVGGVNKAGYVPGYRARGSKASKQLSATKIKTSRVHMTYLPAGVGNLATGLADYGCGVSMQRPLRCARR